MQETVNLLVGRRLNGEGKRLDLLRSGWCEIAQWRSRAVERVVAAITERENLENGKNIEGGELRYSANCRGFRIL